jgi:hypothetical protein
MALGTSLSIIMGYINAYRLYIRLVGYYPYIDHKLY